MNERFPGLKYSIPKAIYKHSNRIEEKLTKFINFGVIKLLHPTIMIVMWSANYYAYFTTDLRSDAFLLNFPYWYVNSFKFYSILLSNINLLFSYHFIGFHLIGRLQLDTCLHSF